MGGIHDGSLGVIVISMSLWCHVMTSYSPQSAGKRNAAYQTTPTGVRRGVMHCGGSAASVRTCSSLDGARRKIRL